MKTKNGTKKLRHQIGKLGPQTMKRAGKKKKYLKSQVAGSNLVSDSSEQPAREADPSTSEICVPEESLSSSEIFEQLDTMLKSNADWPDIYLAELIEDIDHVLSREKENTGKAPGLVTKSTELGHMIKSVCVKIFEYCENNNEVAVGVLKTIGELHWAATGFVLVAPVLEKLHAVKRNRKESLMLLKSMNDLAKIVMELGPLPYKTASTQTTIKESIYTILKGAMSCSKMTHRGIASRMAHTEKDREELLDVRREIEELRSTLHVEITVCIFKWQCDFRKEWRGANERNCHACSNILNESSNPTKILSRKDQVQILDYYQVTKHENKDLNESSKPT